MKRIDALRVIDEAFAGCPLVVTCGATSRELASIAKRPSHLYLLDSMGLAAAVGAGVALAGRGPVAAIEGDGSLLMGLSVLATIAHQRPPRFTLIVLDNHQHASAGGMPTQAVTVSLAALCEAAGLDTETVSTPDALGAALRAARGAEGPTAVVAAIEPGNAAGIDFLLEDPVLIGARFAGFLKGDQ